MNRDIIILLIISTLLTIPVVHTIGQSIHIPQNKAAIENFTLNEDDTLRYAHHYLYERAYQVIADMLTDKRSVDMADAFRCVCAGEIASDTRCGFNCRMEGTAKGRHILLCNSSRFAQRRVAAGRYSEPPVLYKKIENE